MTTRLLLLPRQLQQQRQQQQQQIRTTTPTTATHSSADQQRMASFRIRRSYPLAPLLRALHKLSLLFLILLFTAAATPVCAIADADAAAAVSELQQVHCVTVWGSTARTKDVVPAEKINDGYCDCIETGQDEPNTAACAGLSHWAGLPLSHQKKTT